MDIAKQKYEVTQIFAEAEARGLSLEFAAQAVMCFFVVNKIEPPLRLLDWLAEEAPKTLH